MHVSHKSPEEFRKAGLEALVRDLGPAGMLRFIRQIEPGKGDYTSERHTWLPTDMEKVMAEIRTSKAKDQLYPQ